MLAWGLEFHAPIAMSKQTTSLPSSITISSDGCYPAAYIEAGIDPGAAGAPDFGAVPLPGLTQYRVTLAPAVAVTLAVSSPTKIPESGNSSNGLEMTSPTVAVSFFAGMMLRAHPRFARFPVRAPAEVTVRNGTRILQGRIPPSWSSGSRRVWRKSAADSAYVVWRRQSLTS